MKKIDKHYGYYIFLIVVLVIGLIITWKLGPDKNLQFLSLVVLSVIYAVIGIIHHLQSHDLVSKIVIEYVLIACLGVAAAFFIFKGGFGF